MLADEQMVLRHRADYLNLLGLPDIEPVHPNVWQERKIQVKIPTANLLTAEVLNRMMDNIDRTDSI